MICITGAERSTEKLATRLAEHPDALHEVRLDALEQIDRPVEALIRQHGRRLVVCCRAERDGGGFRGPESRRLELLRRCQRLGARFIDLEVDADPVDFDPSGLVVSEHDFEGMGEPVARLRALAGRGAVAKLAVTVREAAELSSLYQAAQAFEGDAVVIGMGEAGLLSRGRYRAFGSRWTYVAAEAGLKTAAGQLTVSEAEQQGIDEDAPFCALVGGPQVRHSPGPQVYSQLFAQRADIAARSYLPVISERLGDLLPLLTRLGCVGLSVTMPLKAQAAQLADGDDLVRRLGAANTLRFTEGRWEATNSDVEGVRRPLRPHVREGQRALVLGAGGAAAAAAEACRSLGLSVAVAARRAQAAHAIGLAVPWETRSATQADVVINATPIVGHESPWPATSLEAAVVFDLAMGPEPRALRRQAKGVFLGPMDMWLAQGVAQMQWIFGVQIDEDELRCRLG